MPGTSIGAKKVADKLRAKDPDFYRKIGSKGGKNGAGTKKGFAYSSETAKSAGSKGGSISKRGHVLVEQDDEYRYYMSKKTGKLLLIKKNIE